MRQLFLSPSRVAGGVVSLALLGVASCGGDGDEKDKQSSPPAAAKPAPAKPKAGPESPYQTPAVPKQELEKRRKREAAQERKAGLKLRLERRERAVAVANAMLPLLQIADSTVATADGARIVVISLTGRGACKLGRGEDRRLAIAVRDALTFVKEVKLRVGPKRALSAYRADRCPGGGGEGGPVVLQEDGRGVETTEPFQIRSRSWTVEYGYDKGFFRAHVLRGSRLIRVIGSAPGRIGKRELTGPGTFRLKISAGGTWSVTVRDGDA